MCNVFIQHTSASIIVCENYDPSVLADLEYFMTNLVPNGADWMQHIAEGKDDMSAHIRSVLTQSSINIPIQSCKLALGAWQGILLWEHRDFDHRRNLIVTVQSY